MKYRRFGKTDLHLSIFSLGTMRCLGSSEIAAQTIAKAIELGINHVETAQGYGRSEEYLGLVLTNNPHLAKAREKVYITTKLSPTPDAQQMSQWLDRSLARLQVDYIDCLAIHGINTWQHLDWVTSDRGCLPAIQTAIKSGKIRHLGFSTHGSLELILATIKTNLFSFINLHYYYFWQRNKPAIVLAQEKDMGIFIISPGDKGGRLYTPSPTLQKLCRPFSPLELNYRFLLSDPRITTLSLGAANPQELIAPLQVAAKDYPLTTKEQEIFKQLTIHQKNSLTNDLCRQCYQCLPCPEEINIPEILRLRNLAIAYDMTDYGKYRYGMLENAGHWFPGNKGNRCTSCGDCLPRCPETLNIPKLLQDSHQRLKGSSRRRLWQD